ncbi:transglutaminase domain-containing protein [Xanthomarina sp. GH4-25]|uniref:transglutaminase domain-containing protein n=1 Tax=Xanthomarina sp. GH4-25 TaxID=3349335 RepID=UPI003877FE90
MRKNILLLFILFNFGSVFSQTDAITNLINETDELNLDMRDFVNYAKDKIKDKTELTKFFYYWVGTHIEYDYVLFQSVLDKTVDPNQFQSTQDEYVVYENRKGICAGYANLFKWFMNEIDIEAVVVSGHIRDERNHYVELSSDDNYRHAWNSIKLNNKWLLVDSTWGTSDDISVSDFYFDIDPNIAIISHYPSEPKWQLLENPLSLEEFNNSKFVKPIWFFSGYTDIPTLKADNDFYYLVYQSNPNKNCSVELMYSIDNSNFYPIKNLVKIEQDNFTYLRFPKKEISKTAYFKLNLTISKMYGNTRNTFITNGTINFKT